MVILQADGAGFPTCAETPFANRLWGITGFIYIGCDKAMEKIVYLLFAIICFVIPFLPKARLWAFRKNGEKCEGTIYRVSYIYTDEGGKTVDRITVQFTTKRHELITADLAIGGPGFWMLFKEGDKVSVIYDVSHPTRFTLAELPSDPLVKAACVMGGLFFLVCWA